WSPCRPCRPPPYAPRREGSPTRPWSPCPAGARAHWRRTRLRRRGAPRLAGPQRPRPAQRPRRPRSVRADRSSLSSLRPSPHPGLAYVSLHRHSEAAHRGGPSRRSSRGAPSSRERRLTQVAVHQLLHELDALELLQPRVLADPPIEIHAHLPGSCEGFGIVDRRLVAHHVWADRRVALGHRHRRRVVIASAVEPGRIHLPRDGDDQAVALPA